ncbi:hypothetical protein CVE34_05575 [Pseudomonas syringae pv. actinidiae]|uniref:Uncharacterized protein n=2 Tax=Pseudomonas syringae group TaxID=136849 RepID=A0A261WEU2_9PSED|nr:hypothetical protein CT122_19045 [Pseudomonas syringae pv. actinidiae]AYL80731.1 hypothetical protein CN228_12880 [Pseudomonas syringae pv. actinidiae str. Shaanxi_M228]MBL3831249.1 hypothetical protein [Pseudomonas syringae pv. theae]NAS98115.1 hypothetical protein [Pseudomonas syringae pv. actinidifoliorum]OZI84510.1 hypothetical protein CFN58_23935 [Pseudomonas avellanae]
MKISTVYWPRKMAIADAINAGVESNSKDLKRHAGPGRNDLFGVFLMALGQTDSA